MGGQEGKDYDRSELNVFSGQLPLGLLNSNSS